MAKLRHIAIQVPDLQKAAKFYEDVFDLKRVAEVEAPIGNAISLSDGVVNLTLLHFPEGTKGGKGGPDWAGLHHFGFIVENGPATEDENRKERRRVLHAAAEISRRRRRAEVQGHQRHRVRRLRARLDAIQRELMRIVAVRERTIELSSATRNSSISFDAMTASVIAVHTDASKDGRPLVGLAFDSIGRYGHGGLLRERFIPRLLAADPDDYADGDGGIDPHRAWAVLMKDEKPGGHGERSGAVGLIDAALWDLAAKADGKPLWSLLAKRHGDGDASAKIAVYASGGHYRAANDIEGLCEDVRRAIGQGHRRFKIKIGGASLADDIKRIEAVFGLLERGMSLAVDGNGTLRSRPRRCSISTR